MGMGNDNTTFEIMIHVMEASVVIGIAITIYLTKRFSNKKKRDTHDDRDPS